MTGQHALHKILMAHVQPRPSTVTPGEFLQIEPDVFAVQVATNVEEVDRLEADLKDLGVEELPIRHKIFPFIDHGAPAPTAGIAAGQKRWRDFYKNHGIPVTDPGAGISHLILNERGIVAPGCVIALRDSHTLTMGAVGAFAMSLAGGTLSLFAIGRYFLDVPNVALVNIEGSLNKGVFGRDVALHINGKLGQRGLLGRAVEFGGSYVRNLSMDMRFTLCNMGTRPGPWRPTCSRMK